ncbi:MAG TPA: YoaK family protein [Candidatus Limnocylindria bacterium]
MRELRRRDLLLIALTFAAGSVDAVALLRLDVFTAVMTGNIVLLGLAIGQGAFGNVLRSVVALVAYGIGVIVAARIVGAVAIETHWSPKVTRALAVEWVLQLAFLIGWLLTGANPDGVSAAALIAFSGLAMGIQAATARALAPGMSTTYVTGTLTGLLSELSALGSVSGDRLRRASIVVALAFGAVAGALALSTVPLLAPAIPLAVVGAVVLVAATRFR